MTNVTFVFGYCTVTVPVVIRAIDEELELSAINIARVSVQDELGFDPVNRCQDIVVENV